MPGFLQRHQSTIVTFAVIAGITSLIWLEEHRHQAIPAGTSAPALDLAVMGEAEHVTLASLHGEPAVLDFWATWCSVCKRSLPELNALSKRYEGKVRFLAVNAESENVDRQRQTRDQIGLQFPVAVNGVEAASLYNVDALPTTVVIDQHGKVAASFVGAVSPAELAATIDDVLAAHGRRVPRQGEGRPHFVQR